MTRGDTFRHTHKHKRHARHIEESYASRGVPAKEAEARAWATVNSMTQGGKKSGSGRGKPKVYSAARKGSRLGGAANGKTAAESKKHR